MSESPLYHTLTMLMTVPRYYHPSTLLPHEGQDLFSFIQITLESDIRRHGHSLPSYQIHPLLSTNYG
jgi:hypothetical protein